jgi:hypothetical protein
MHGCPNLVTTFSNRNRATISVVQSIIGVVYAHLVKYFVAIMIYLAHDLLACGLIGLAKSMAHFSNAYNVTYGFKFIVSLLYGFPTHWHTSHDSKYSFACL